MLADVFHKMKGVEEWGSGLRRVSEELAAYGAKPLQLEDGGLDVRLNVFRNPPLSEKQHIDTEKQHIGDKKQHIGVEEQHIGHEKPHMDLTQFSTPTRRHIMALHRELKDEPAFARKDVCRITGLTPRVASTLLSRMLAHKIIEPVSGHGKGAYRFV